MAGAGYKLFNTGDVLLASEVNTYLQQQTVMVFASSTARTTALSGVLAEGMMSYLQDTNSVEVYNGSSWVNVGNAGDITGVTAGTGISGGGTSGDVTITNSMATAIDAKGDLIVGTGADTFSRLAVGTNGHTLVADSGEATGLKWAAPSSGALTLIKRASFTGAAGTGTTFDDMFSSTYSTYVIFIENLFTTTGTADAEFQLRYAGPTTQTANYYGQAFNASFTDTGIGSVLGQNNTNQFKFLIDMGVSGNESSAQINVTRVGDGSRRPNIWGIGMNGDGNYGPSVLSATNSTAQVYTGFLVKASSGNITGTIAVYGYQE